MTAAEVDDLLAALRNCGFETLDGVTSDRWSVIDAVALGGMSAAGRRLSRRIGPDAGPATGRTDAT